VRAAEIKSEALSTLFAIAAFDDFDAMLSGLIRCVIRAIVSDYQYF